MSVTKEAARQRACDLIQKESDAIFNEKGESMRSVLIHTLANSAPSGAGADSDDDVSATAALNAFVTKLEKHDAWGGHLSLTALATAYRVCVVVVSAITTVPIDYRALCVRPYGCAGADVTGLDIITLGLLNDKHYLSLVNEDDNNESVVPRVVTELVARLNAPPEQAKEFLAAIPT